MCLDLSIACPLGKHLSKTPDGAALFQGISGKHALQLLREALRSMRVDAPSEYGTHAFRRGHARDLAEAGTPLAIILKAGQWRSQAFMRYLDPNDIETLAALEVAYDSDDCEYID